MFDTPFTFPCGLTVPNRIAKASMTERLAGPDARANAGLARLYQTFADGGAGLLLTGNVIVDGRYLEAPGNVVVEDMSGLAELRAWARAGQSRGAAMIMQLNQAGRQVPRSVAAESVAPSAVPLAARRFFSTPRAMTETEILETVERFALAAAAAERAGFSGVEIHAAHGYLLSQFLSPRVNRRTDAWGGSVENRARLLLHVVRRVREVVAPSFAVGIKLNVEDYVKGGLAADEALQVGRLLDPLGIDFLELSGGTHEYPVTFDAKAAPTAFEGFFLQHAAAMRRVCGAPLLLTGGMRSRDGMTRALTAGACDLVGMARPLALEPDLPRRLLEGRAAAARPVALNLPPPPRAALAELNWARVQLGRMARGLQPKLTLSPKLALVLMLLSDRRFSRKRRAYLARHPRAPFQPLAQTRSGELSAPDHLARRSHTAFKPG